MPWRTCHTLWVRPYPARVRVLINNNGIVVVVPVIGLESCVVVIVVCSLPHACTGAVSPRSSCTCACVSCNNGIKTCGCCCLLCSMASLPNKLLLCWISFVVVDFVLGDHLSGWLSESILFSQMGNSLLQWCTNVWYRDVHQLNDTISLTLKKLYTPSIP